MADLLLTFNGRIGRLGYLLSLLCMGIALVMIFMLQRYLGAWKFSSIFITVAAMVPVIIYLTGTSKRFQDRGRHPLVGFILYFIIPALLIFGVQRFLGEAFISPENMKEQLSGISSLNELPQNLIIQLGAFGVATLVFLFGQINLFLGKGTPDENAFDENQPLGVEA